MVPSLTANLFLFVALYGSPAAAFMQPNPQTLGIGHRPTSCGTRSVASSVVNDNVSLCHIKPLHRASLATTTTRLHLFGFGEKVDEDQEGLQENELARFSHLLSSDDNPTTKFDSLSIMILEWSKLFMDPEKKMGLTTPVALVELPKDENMAGVQLLFRKTKKGYADKDRKNEEDKPGNKNQKEEAVKEGGVEIRVKQLAGGEFQVVASRCEIEEGTMIKEMSEQTIIDSLKKAMAAWKKEQGWQ